MNILGLAVGALALGASGAATATIRPATGDAPPYAHAFLESLDPLVKSLGEDFGEFGIAIAVIENGRTAGERYYGFADAQRKVRMSGRTLVNVASVSKAVSAFGVMRLADKRRIDLDAPVFDRITRWKLPPSEFSVSRVTVARLLSHTSGMSRHTTGTWTVRDRLPTLEAALSGDNGGYGDTRLIREPGTKWSYSGGGYSILQLLVEEVTGKGFTEYMNTEVLPALGIRSSWFGWGPRVERASATSYDEFWRPVDAYRTIELAAGGYNANAPDLARFALAFSKVRNGNNRPALSAPMMQQMLTPVPAGELGPDMHFGLGIMLHKLDDGRTLVSHDGGNPGSGAYFAINPQTGDGLAILVNRSWGGQVFLPIACTWRNATAPAGASAKPCNRDLTGIIVNTLAKQGIDAAKAQFDHFAAQSPNRLGEQQMLRMARQLSYAERQSDAEAVLRWHLADNPNSAPAYDRLGDVLLAAGKREGARTAWEASLKIKSDQPEVQRKINGLAH